MNYSANKLATIFGCTVSDIININRKILFEQLKNFDHHILDLSGNDKNKIIVNNQSKIIYNKQVIYAINKKFEIHYSDYRMILMNRCDYKETKILH
jgi:hypothetical protein